ncbi:2-hydroxy-1,4-benzoquinone reductase [compost metagenome]
MIKSAIEWGSRPWGQSSWGGKPVAITGTSIGAVGAAAAQTQLRIIMPHLDMVLMGQPEIYLKTTPGLFDEHDEVTNEETRTLLLNFVRRFATFLERHGEANAKIAAE